MEFSRTAVLVLVVVGLILLYLGYQSTETVTEQVYETFAGQKHADDHAVFDRRRH